MQLRLTPNNTKTLCVIVWLLRIVAACVFMFSGFVKAVDIWGSIYKFEEYFTTWGWSLSHACILVSAVVLVATEFTLGIMLLFGMLRRMSTYILTAFMVIMTPLTLYILIKSPVSDCGCFGDALIISNTATFIKNIVLLIIAIYLIFTNHRVRCLIEPSLQWIGITLTLAFIITISVIGYKIQPLIDFRPYPIGTSIAPVNIEPVDVDGIKFVYEKAGQRKEFDATNLPDDTWTFVKRINPSFSSDEDIVVMDEYGDDVTNDIFENQAKTLVMLITDPQKVGLSRAHMATELSVALAKNKGSFAVLIAANYPGGIDKWRHFVHAQYPVYEVDDTSLKMLARGDVSLLYLTDGVIKWKYNAYYLDPDLGKTTISNSNTLDKITPIEESNTLTILLTTYIITMLLLLAYRPLCYLIDKNKKKQTITAEKA